jgi:hypothetical protein
MRLMPANPSSLAAAAVLAGLAGLAACTRAPEPSLEVFTQAMNTYLAERGHLCLAKRLWPIDVTQQDVDVGARNALQMPVLERLGLVSSSVAQVEVDDEGTLHRMAVRRYVLTDAGRTYFVRRGPAKAGEGASAGSDFCAARLSLDRIVDWKVDAEPGSPTRRATVTYTYRVDAAPWTKDAGAQRVFPVVAGIVRGAGTARLQETFAQTDTGWVAVDPRGS